MLMKSGFCCLLLITPLVCVADDPAVEAPAPLRIIFDTDANNELDDQHALAYMLLNRDVFDIEGVTVNKTHGGGGIDAHFAEADRIVRLCGLEDEIRVTKGAEGSFYEIMDHIDESNFDGSDAVNLIIERAHADSDRPLLLVPVGKLTNIALALKKDPTIASKVRVIWLGSNYPNPGEYNQVNDEPSLVYVLETDVPFEIALVRYGVPSGTDAVRTTLEEVRENMPGRGPRAAAPVKGRHGGQFECFGDYSVNLFEHIQMHGNPPSRALYDMAALAIVKNPGWATAEEVPAPQLVVGEGTQGRWVDQPDNTRRITLWKDFNRDAIIADFYATMERATE